MEKKKGSLKIDKIKADFKKAKQNKKQVAESNDKPIFNSAELMRRIKIILKLLKKKSRQLYVKIKAKLIYFSKNYRKIIAKWKLKKKVIAAYKFVAVLVKETWKVTCKVLYRIKRVIMEERRNIQLSNKAERRGLTAAAKLLELEQKDSTRDSKRKEIRGILSKRKKKFEELHGK